jgi:hypothetical protein
VQYEEFLDRSSGAEVSRDDAESLAHAVRERCGSISIIPKKERSPGPVRGEG